MKDKFLRIYNLEKLIEPNKILAIFGPRRSGKTTLVQNFLKQTKLKYRYDTGDDVSLYEKLGSQRLNILKDYVEDYELIVIDEAHLVPNIGVNLKLIVDNIPNINVIITGSSSFDLANQIGEPLVGRKFTYLLYPISFFELQKYMSIHEINEQMEKALIYGMYPEVLTSSSHEAKIKYLNEITNSYLFKDILIFEGIKNSKILLNLLRLLAFQIGSEVSLTELGNSLEIDKKTVARYLDLLEKTYIIYPLRPYFSNQRKSVTKKNKYYFLDLGVRNTIIENFNVLPKRDDLGKLWENFLVIERLKKQAYKPIYCSNYFWRSLNNKEVDWVEMRDGKLLGYEFKWGKTKNTNEGEWLKSYPKEAVFDIIDKENYLDFIAR